MLFCVVFSTPWIGSSWPLFKVLSHSFYFPLFLPFEINNLKKKGKKGDSFKPVFPLLYLQKIIVIPLGFDSLERLPLCGLASRLQRRLSGQSISKRFFFSKEFCQLQPAASQWPQQFPMNLISSDQVCYKVDSMNVSRLKLFDTSFICQIQHHTRTVRLFQRKRVNCWINPFMLIVFQFCMI